MVEGLEKNVCVYKTSISTIVDHLDLFVDIK